MFIRANILWLMGIIIFTPALKAADDSAKFHDFKAFNLDEAVFSAASHTLYCKPASGNPLFKPWTNESALNLMQHLVTFNLRGSIEIPKDIKVDRSAGGKAKVNVVTESKTVQQFLKDPHFSSFEWQADLEAQVDKIPDFSDEDRKELTRYFDQVKQLRQLAEGYLRWALKTGKEKKYPFYSLIPESELTRARTEIKLEESALYKESKNASRKQVAEKQIAKKFETGILTQAAILFEDFLEKSTNKKARPSIEIDKTYSLTKCGEKEPTFHDKNPFFKTISFRKTAADILKTNGAEGAAFSYTKRKVLDLSEDKQTKTNTYSVDAVLGIKSPSKLFFDEAPTFYLGYKLADIDEEEKSLAPPAQDMPDEPCECMCECENCPSQDEMCPEMEEDDIDANRTETFNIGIIGKFADIPLGRTLYRSVFHIQHTVYDFSYINDFNFNSESLRGRFTNHHAFCFNRDLFCIGSKEKDYLGNPYKGFDFGEVTLRTDINSIIEYAYILEAGDNINFLAFEDREGNEVELDEPLDNPSDYFGVGGKAGVMLDFKGLVLGASYRYLYIPGDRVPSQDTFRANLDYKLIETKNAALSFGIEYREGDDEDTFQNIDEAKFTVKVKF